MATMTTTGTDDGLQRAALVLAALGPSGCAEIAPALGPDGRRALEAARLSPGRLSAQERRKLLASVARACRARRAAGGRASGGAGRRGPGEDTDVLPCSVPRRPPFAFMDELDPVEAGALLCGERPGVIALVMAHASEVVAKSAPAALPPETRGEVARALPVLRRPAPGVLRRLDEALQEQLDRRRQDERRCRRTARRLAAAVTTTDESAARQILDELVHSDPSLSEAVARELALASDIPTQAPENERSRPV